MKILIVTQYFWPENFRINDLVAGLIERGHECTVLTGLPNYPTGKIFRGYGVKVFKSQIHDGARVIRVPLMPRGSGSGLRLALNYISFALFASLFGPFLCRGRYDLVFVYEPSPITVMLPALLLKKLKGAPVMLWLQDLWPESVAATGAIRSKAILKLIERLVRFIYRGCDKILTTSRAYHTSIIERGGHPEKIEYFPQSVEKVYRPVEVEGDAPERAHIPNGFNVMFAGNIGAAQDFPTILDAASILKDRRNIHWVIVGDGRMRAWVEKQVLDRGLVGCVHLIGKYPLDAMPRFFALADVMLVTLRKDPIFSLTVPAKIQSYMACGRPIVAALDGEGARIVRESGAGFTVSAERPDLLADAVLAASCMPVEALETMGAGGLAYFNEHFERNMLYDKFECMMGAMVPANAIREKGCTTA